MLRGLILFALFLSLNFILATLLGAGLVLLLRAGTDDTNTRG